VRDKAEDAVRKTGALLAQERKEKARLKKDVERLQAEIEDLRLENEQKTALDEESDDTATPLPPASLISSKKDEEIESLRAIIKNQVAEIKTLKASHTSTITTLKATHDSTLTSLRSEIATLQSRLDTQATDHEAINRAMDEQLSHLLSKLMKERARTVVGKRDGQWEEVQKNAASEKELLGKVLMRQWGREECGSAEEKRGQKQLFEYKYVKRER
jgi:myosin protein heavy chain